MHDCAVFTDLTMPLVFFWQRNGTVNKPSGVHKHKISTVKGCHRMLADISIVPKIPVLTPDVIGICVKMPPT